MHELTLENLPMYAEGDDKLVTALFSLSGVAHAFDELVAPKSIDVWMARDILEVNAFSDQILPVGDVEGTEYYLVIAITEISQSYVFVPKTRRIQLVDRPIYPGIRID